MTLHPDPKACPFCNSSKIDFRGNDASKVWWMVCEACSAEGPLSENTQVEAIEKWNHRESQVPVPDPHVPGSWLCPTCGFFQVSSILNPETGASGPARVVDADRLICPNDGTVLLPETWKQRAENRKAENAALLDGLEVAQSSHRAVRKRTSSAGPLNRGSDDGRRKVSHIQGRMGRGILCRDGEIQRHTWSNRETLMTTRTIKKPRHCSACGQQGHNARTCVTHTSTVDTLMEDIGVKPAQIGDMVNFRDNSGIKWRGAVLDIRRMVTTTNGMVVREDQIDAVILDPGLRIEARLAPVEPWAFVACIAQPQTVAVRLNHCWPHERGWWHRESAAPSRPEGADIK